MMTLWNWLESLSPVVSSPVAKFVEIRILCQDKDEDFGRILGNRNSNIFSQKLIHPNKMLSWPATEFLQYDWPIKEIYNSERFEVLKVHSKICPISWAYKKSMHISWSFFEKPKGSVLGFLQRFKLGIFEKINCQCQKWTFRQSN